MKFLFPVFALFLFCKLCIAEEDFRTWTSSDGRKIQAKFIEMVGKDTVKIKIIGGREFDLEKAKISEADWKYVEGVVAEQKVKEVKEEMFRLPKPLSSKGCVIIASLKGNVEVFDNPSEEGSFGGFMLMENMLNLGKQKVETLKLANLSKQVGS